MKPEDYIVYGDKGNDSYFIVKEDEELLIVHEDWFYYEAASLFKLAFDGDWSKEMIMDSAKKVVDHLNETNFYPRTIL